jgi:hypothetical protein
MIVIDERPELAVHSLLEAELRVERTDISFEDLPGDFVRIRVRISNEGGGRSRPTLMRLESAPLGAFVPWQPLAVLSVPAIEPGESRELSVDVKRPRPAPLGNFDRIPPKSLLTAVNAPDDSSPPNRGLGAMMKLLRPRETGRPAAPNIALATGLLSPDLWELVGGGQPHWAGNINVFIGARPVERHLAKALRVYPGRANMAMFMVGGFKGRRDAYSFDIVGLAADWKAALYDVTNRSTLVVGSSDTPVQETKWVEAVAGLMVVLATHPPAGCKEGKVEVHVTRRSSQETAIVEFDLDPAAQGTGCYSV